MKGLWIKALCYFIKQALIYFKKMHRDNKIRRCHWPTVSIWHAKMAMYEWVFINILWYQKKHWDLSAHYASCRADQRESAVILIFWKGRYTFILYWKILFLPPKKLHYTEVMTSKFNLLFHSCRPSHKILHTFMLSMSLEGLQNSWAGKQKEQHTITVSQGCLQD